MTSTAIFVKILITLVRRNAKSLDVNLTKRVRNI